MSARFCWTAPLIAAVVGSFFAARTKADVVVWRVTTTGGGPTLSRAKEFHDRRLKKALGLQDELGINPKDVQTRYPTIKKSFNRTKPSGYSVRRTTTFIQRDLKRFDEFFQKMAVLDSDYVQVEFSYESSWRARPDRKPNAVVWQATVIGGGRSLLRAKEYFERDLKKLLALHDEFGIESVDVQTGHPSMKTFPHPSQPDKKPTGYAFQQTITFKQPQVERFEDLLSNLAKLESDYFHFDFSFESTRKR